jgi:hypothetical protein
MNRIYPGVPQMKVQAVLYTRTENNEKNKMQQTKKKEKEKNPTPSRWIRTIYRHGSNEIASLSKIEQELTQLRNGDRIFKELPVWRSRYGPVEQ